MENKKVDVLGVSIDNISMSTAKNRVVGWLKSGGKHYIVTPNPEFVMAAQSDSEFKDILNKADLSIPDGVGLKLCSDIENTIPGVDFMEELISVSADLGATVGFLGGRYMVARKTVECLQKKYPKLKVAFADNGGEIDNEGASLKSSKPFEIPKLDILFVAFGQVKQEKWIYKNLPNIPVKVAMGVGGSFGYLSGTVPRAPKVLRLLGLEWLFRLVLQPWRIKRQFWLLKFIWKVVIH